MPSLNNAKGREQKNKDAYDKTENIYQDSVRDRDEIKENLDSEGQRARLSNQIKPGWIRRLFKWAEWKTWKSAHVMVPM